MSDRRWSLLEGARAPLIEAFTAEGVCRIEYVAAFPDLESFSVWLCTSTDEQRDALASRGRIDEPDRVDRVVREREAAAPVSARVQGVLLESGFTEADLSELLTVVQSRQTVDRDFEGSWFYATR